MNIKIPIQVQHRQPGIEADMYPLPESLGGNYKASNKLKDKVAIITGGDSGIGRAVAFCFALEGANVTIVYLNEDQDAALTKDVIEEIGRKCLVIKGDLTNLQFCERVVKETINTYGQLNILINNAAEQHLQSDVENITCEQLENTFKTNIFSYFYMTKFSLPYLKEGSSIINTTSVTAYHGNPKLIDYSSTKGAIVSFTRSLAINLADRNIRVNGVAPGPIWTPLIPSTFSAKEIEKFGRNVPMKRPGQPREVAPCYVFLASEDASYMTGQILHPNGGSIING